MADNESWERLTAYVEAQVRGGFATARDIINGLDERVEDEVGAPEQALVDRLRSYAEDAIKNQLDREKTWTGTTMNSRLDAAFDELNRGGIIALQNAGYSMTEGWDAVAAARSRLDREARGAAFYHWQDVEAAVDGQGLYLAFGAHGEGAAINVASEIREVLHRHRVATEWNGQVDSRIFIPPFEWRRRMPAD